jgi:hypothetical protein
MRVNQWSKPRKSRADSNLADMGQCAVRDSDRHGRSGSTPKPVVFAGGEAMLNACGVGVAKLPGYSWPPPWSNGYVTNVGTIHGRPSLPASGWVDGQARCQLMAMGAGGGPVVVVGVTPHQGGRESRPQGQGGQQVSSKDAGMFGGRR